MFEQISLRHRLTLKKWIGIDHDHDVLEIGCDIGRDAMRLIQILSGGSYIIIVIIAESIDWCRNNISRTFPNFSFYHFDVKDSLHNPRGKSNVRCLRFPKEDGFFDLVFAFSVFTHMYAAQVAHYLSECSRVLRLGGRVYLTIFLYNEKILESASRHAITPFDLKFSTELEPGCRINDPAQPLGAIAFTWQRMQALIAAA